MYQYRDRSIVPNPILKERARSILFGKYGKAVLAFFLVWAISLGADLIIRFFFSFIWAVIMITKALSADGMTAKQMFELMNDPQSLNIYPLWFQVFDHIIGFVVSVFTGVFHVGLSLFCLNMACGMDEDIRNIFFGFAHKFGKSLKLSAVYMAALEIASLPLTILTRLYTQKAPDQVLLTFFGLTAVGVVIAAYILLHISQCFFLMLDFPDYSASELLRQSSRIMKGHKNRLLMLCVSFAPLLIMSLFTFGIANLWIIPYLDVSRAFFFMNLMQAREAAMGEEPLEYQ